MKTNRIRKLPGAAGVLFALVAAVVLLGGWQRSRAEGGNSDPFVWHNYMVRKHISHDMPTHVDVVADQNSNRLYVTYGYSTLLRVNTDTGAVEEMLTGLERPLWLALSLDGEQLFVSQDQWDGMIAVVDTDSFEVVDMLPSPANYVVDLAAGPNNRLYVSHQFDTEVTISSIDTVTGAVVGDVALTPGSEYFLALSPDGNVLYALRRYSIENELDLVRLDVTGADPAILLNIPLTAELDSVEVAPDGSFLVMRQLAGDLVQYDSDDLSLIRTIVVDREGGDAVISGDGTLISRFWPPQNNFGPRGIQSFDTMTGELVYQYLDTAYLDEVGYGRRLIPLGGQRLALVYAGAIRIVQPAEHGLALPVINTSQYCAPSIFDDFSNPNSGWPSGQSGWTTYGYQDNQYRIYHHYADRWAAVTAGDLMGATDRMSVEGQVLDDRLGYWGIVFGLNQDWSEFYTFEIAPQFQAWLYLHYTDSWGWQLIAQGESSFINTSGWNEVEIRYNGYVMDLQVNGHLMKFIQPISGQVGITGGAFDGLLDIRYDNYSLIHACPPPNQRLGVAGPVMMLERPALTMPAEMP